MKSIYKSAVGKKQIHDFYNLLLRDWPKPNAQYFIETELGKTHVIEAGKTGDPALLLIHGSGSNSAMWLGDIEMLSKDFHVFTVDIPGECGLSEEYRPPFKDNVYALWLKDLVLKLNLDKVSIWGCSLGGWIALEFAINFPNYLNKLVLTAPAGIVPIKGSAVFWVIFTSVFGRQGFKKLTKLVYRNVDVDGKAIQFAQLLKNYYRPRTDVLPIFRKEQLKQINSETLFLGGENDCFYNTVKSAKRISENIAFAECFILNNTGHVIINQTDKIRQFLIN